jgi:hypothetical protein
MVCHRAGGTIEDMNGRVTVNLPAELVAKAHRAVETGATAVVLRRPRARFYRLAGDVTVKARFELRQNNTMVFAELARSGCGLTF